MANGNEFTLLKERRFLPFFITQFLGAFNDNVFKNALIILIAFQAAADPARANTLVNLSAGLFVLPFFLFSATAGQLADKYEKSHLMRWIKLLEIVIMLGAAVGFILGEMSVLIGLLFLMGWQSTLFGPVKYSIMPQHLTAGRVGRRQRLDRDGHQSRHPDRHSARWGADRQPRGAVCGVAGAVIVLAVLGFLQQPFDSQRPRRPRSRPENQLESGYRNLAHPSDITRQNSSPCSNRCWAFPGSGSWAASYLAQLPNYSKLTPGRRRACGDAAADHCSPSASACRLAAVRAAVRAEGGNRPGAVRLHRPDRVRVDLFFAVSPPPGGGRAVDGRWSSWRKRLQLAGAVSTSC
jgi:hypothetical protein